MALIFNTIE